jgi:hypothetical protein
MFAAGRERKGDAGGQRHGLQKMLHGWSVLSVMGGSLEVTLRGGAVAVG